MDEEEDLFTEDKNLFHLDSTDEEGEDLNKTDPNEKVIIHFKIEDKKKLKRAPKKISKNSRSKDSPKPIEKSKSANLSKFKITVKKVEIDLNKSEKNRRNIKDSEESEEIGIEKLKENVLLSEDVVSENFTSDGENKNVSDSSPNNKEHIKKFEVLRKSSSPRNYHGQKRESSPSISAEKREISPRVKRRTSSPRTPKNSSTPRKNLSKNKKSPRKNSKNLLEGENNNKKKRSPSPRKNRLQVEGEINENKKEPSPYKKDENKKVQIEEIVIEKNNKKRSQGGSGFNLTYNRINSPKVNQSSSITPKPRAPHEKLRHSKSAGVDQSYIIKNKKPSFSLPEKELKEIILSHKENEENFEKKRSFLKIINESRGGILLNDESLDMFDFLKCYDPPSVPQKELKQQMQQKKTNKKEEKEMRKRANLKKKEISKFVELLIKSTVNEEQILSELENKKLVKMWCSPFHPYVIEGPSPVDNTCSLPTDLPEYIHCISVSTYPFLPEKPQREGSPICDSYRVVMYPNGLSFVTLCDGCNWGKTYLFLFILFIFMLFLFFYFFIFLFFNFNFIFFIFIFIFVLFLFYFFYFINNLGAKPRDAAIKAKQTFCNYLEENIKSMKDIKKSAKVLIRGVYEAHYKIIEGFEDIWDAGTTTFLGGILTQEPKKDDQYIFLFINVGDCKVLVYDGKNVRDATVGNRQNVSNPCDPGGRIGPYVKDGKSKLRLHFIFF